MTVVLPDRLAALLIELDALWRPSRAKWTFTEVPERQASSSPTPR